jgi:hypothetical protein
LRLGNAALCQGQVGSTTEAHRLDTLDVSVPRQNDLRHGYGSCCYNRVPAIDRFATATYV